MKILQIATQVPVPPIDGGKLSVFGITKSLHKRGHKVDFVCYRKHNDYRISYNMLEKVCTPYILDVQTDNNKFYASKNLFSSIPYNASKYNKEELILFIKKYLKNNTPDIIHIDHLFLGWIVDLLRELSPAPILLRSQNLEMKIMERFYQHQKNPILKYYAYLQYRKFLKYEPYICSKFDLCIMISDIDKENLLSLKPCLNVTSIPAGIEAHLLNMKKNDVIPYSLVHVGHTDWYPNYDGLNWFTSEIMPELVKEIPKLKLYIYGGGNTINYKFPSKLKENIIVVGFVNDLWEELKNKALAIVPLRIGSGIRLKILELLATGTNIITTSIGKEGIDVTNGEELLIADTTEEFREKIIRYFNNEYDKTRMEHKGKNLIRDNYTWEVVSEKLERIYIDLLNFKDE